MEIKIAILLIIAGISSVFAAPGYSQVAKVSLDMKDKNLEQVMDEIERQSEFYFIFNQKQIDVNRVVDIKVESKLISEILPELFVGTDVNYTILDRRILLTTDYFDMKAYEITSGSSQQLKKITGTVSDKDGSPLPGVNVVVTGTTLGTLTDAAGKYSIEIPPGSKSLTFSFIGMESQEITIGTQTQINVTMAESVIGLEEAVVIGYGTMKRRDIVGSTVSVKMDEISRIKVTSMGDALQGMASGLMVSGRSGHPGNAPEIKIRGINSVNLSSDPLWILDGMPIFTGSSEITRDGVKPVSALSMINPNDIESIEVLKDAAATAIYGNRAAGGVILVTTKSAKKGKTGVTFTYDGGLSQIPFSQNDIFVDSKTWWKLMETAHKNEGSVAYTPNDAINRQFLGEKPVMSMEEALATNTDHLGAITQNAVFKQVGMAANRIFESGGVLFSLNYRDEEGLIRNNDFQRLTSRFSFNFKPVESIEVSINSNFIYLKTNGVKSGGGKEGGGWSNWGASLPWYKIYDETSQTGYWAANSGYNMVAFADRKNTRNEVDQYRVINSAYVEWTPINDLRIRGDLGTDLIVNNSSFWRSGLLIPLPPYYSLAEEQSVTKSIVNYSVYANYNKKINIHNVDFTVGTEATRDWSYTRSFSGSGLQTVYPELRNPLIMSSMGGYQGGDTYLMGFFARVNYKLKDRYLLNMSARRDGHSAFSKENRWANFYAVGAGWIITDEEFMQGLDFLSLLKLRGSYGILGNTSVSSSMTYLTWGLSGSRWGVAGPAGSTTVGPLGSNALKWETTANTDLGLDFGLFNNRINGSLAYYTKDINDLILRGEVQPSVGYNSNQVYENIGDMKNWGFEFNVSTINIQKTDFTWRTDFNISTNKNKIIRLNEAEHGKGSEGTQNIRKEGEALNTWYLANYTYVDPEKGIYMIEKRDADIWDKEYKTVATGKIIPATANNVVNNRMVQHGKTPLPTFYGGLSNTFSYKNFDLNVLFYFEGGNWIKNDLYGGGSNIFPETNYIKDAVGKRWEKPGDKADWCWLLPAESAQYYDDNGNPTISRIQYNEFQTTRYLEKGDFIRLRNLQLGYTLPASVFAKSGLNSLRLYVGVTNLLTITGYKGLDPESLSDLPIPRTFNFGLSLNL